MPDRAREPERCEHKFGFRIMPDERRPGKFQIESNRQGSWRAAIGGLDDKDLEPKIIALRRSGFSVSDCREVKA